MQLLITKQLITHAYTQVSRGQCRFVSSSWVTLRERQKWAIDMYFAVMMLKLKLITASYISTN